MAALQPQDRDLIIRTVIGEADGQPDAGKAAVAHVILNRVRSGKFGDSVPGVVLAKHQFEPWTTRAGELRAISPTDPRYLKTAAIVDRVAGGAMPDPTYGSTHFLEPNIVRRRTGGKLPDWAQGEPVVIGAHHFFNPGGTSVDPNSDTDLEALLRGTPTRAASGTAVARSTTTPPTGTGLPSWAVPSRLRAPETADASLDDAALERMLRGPATEIIKPAPTATGPTKPAERERGSGERFARGALRGGKDVIDSLAEGLAYGASSVASGAANLGVIPRSWADSVESSRLGTVAMDKTARDEYDADPQTAGFSAGAGRVTGNIGASLPPITKALQAGRAIGAGVEASLPLISGAMTALRGSFLGRTALAGAGGAGTGAAGAALVSSASDEPLGDQMLEGAKMGGLIGTAGSAVGNALRGSKIPQATADLANRAMNKFGIPIGVGQISSSPAIRFLDSVANRLPMAGGGASRDAQQTAFNRAVSETIGENAEHVTPAVMEAARTRIGRVFESVAARVPVIRADQRLVQDIRTIASDAKGVLTRDEQGPIGHQLKTVFLDAFGQGGSITGEVYQRLTRKGAALDLAMKSTNPNIKGFAIRIRNALDDAMERNAPASVVDDLKEARYHWKNMKTIEDLVEKAPDGNISPALLNGRVRAAFSTKAYGGGGPLAELADIGQRFLKEAPSSGTAERSLIHQLLGLGVIGGAGGLGSGIAFQDPLTGLKVAGGLVGGAMAGRAIGAGLRNQTLAQRNVSQSLAGHPGSFNRLIDRTLPILPSSGAIANQEKNPLRVTIRKDRYDY